MRDPNCSQLGRTRPTPPRVASVWVVSENDAGDSFTQHNLDAFGSYGQNETSVTDAWYPIAGFGVGDSITLKLEPTPITLDGTNMDCAYLLTNRRSTWL